MRLSLLTLVPLGWGVCNQETLLIGSASFAPGVSVHDVNAC